MQTRQTFAILFQATLALISTNVEAAATSTNAPVREGPQFVAPVELNVGRLIENLEFAPVSGRKFRLSDYKSAPAVVIAFTSTSCPVTKRYAPTLAALEQEYSVRGIKFIYVNPIESDSSGDITLAIRTHRFAGPYVRDTKNRIGSKLNARSTAEVFVLDAARTLIYRGAVDDQYGLGYSLEVPRRRYLVEALEAVLAHTTPSVQATTAPGCALQITREQPITVPLTYHARVSRILQQHCVECHRAGGVAPFSLETYADITSHAGMIHKQVSKGVMPPWFAAPFSHGESPWENDRTLVAQDKTDLLAWLNGDKKEGDRADAPLPREFPKDWEIGTPDVIVQIPELIKVKATGTMPYQNIFVETKFTEDRWVRAMEVRPTARDVVHHALVFVVPRDELGETRKRGEGSGGRGFFAGYVPGSNARNFPDGFAKLIPAGATLHFQIHYTPTGTATNDQTAIGLVFAKTPPQHEVHVAAVAAKLDIPPGADNYEVRGTIPVLFDAKILSFMPHMHLRGKSYRYELELPNQEKRVLLDVPRYDFNWQIQYRLREPVDAPVGSRLIGTAHYDNSTNNPANPDPTRRVKWGQQTDDEMMLGYFEYYVPGQVPGTKQSSVLELALRDGGPIFNRLDRNRDGKITIEESPTPKQFRDADADSDGSVTHEEFRDYLQRQVKKNKF